MEADLEEVFVWLIMGFSPFALFIVDIASRRNVYSLVYTYFTCIYDPEDYEVPFVLNTWTYAV
jgi:hypothetical protein